MFLDCEGVGEVFFVKVSGFEEFFKDIKYFIVLLQFYLEVFLQVLGNVWILFFIFRVEQSDMLWYLSEFYMFEVEMSFVSDMDDVMNLVQDMLRFFVFVL